MEKNSNLKPRRRNSPPSAPSASHITSSLASFGKYHDYDDDGLNSSGGQSRIDPKAFKPDLAIHPQHFANQQASTRQPRVAEHVSPFRTFQAHPRDTCHCVYFGLLLAGVGFLLPYDSFVSAVDYFQQKYPGSSVIFDMSFVYILTAFGAVLINNMIVESISMYRRIYFGYCLSFGTLLVVALVEIAWDSFPLNWAYKLNLVCVAVVAFGCTIQQASFYGFASMLPPRYTQAVMAGESASGLIVSVNRIITKALLKDEKISTLIFFFLSISIIVICIFIHNVLQKTAFVQFHLGMCRNGGYESYENQRSTYVSSGSNFDYDCTNGDRVVLGLSSATASYHPSNGKDDSKPKEDLALVEIDTSTGIENQMYGSTSYTSDLTDIILKSGPDDDHRSFKKSPALADPDCDSLQGDVMNVRPIIDVDLLENCPPIGNASSVINPNYDIDHESFLNLSTSENLGRSSQRLLFPSSSRITSASRIWFNSRISNIKQFLGYYYDKICLILSTRIKVISLTWPFMISILTAYLITFSLFPGIESEIISCHFKSWMPVLLLFTFDFAEFIGKISSTFFYTMKPVNLMISCVSRVVLIPLLCFCVAPRTHPLFAHESWSFIFSVALGLSNGICASLPMILAPTRVTSDLKEITGNLMTLSYSIGLTTGSGLAYAVRRTLGQPVSFDALCNATLSNEATTMMSIIADNVTMIIQNTTTNTLT